MMIIIEEKSKNNNIEGNCDLKKIKKIDNANNQLKMHLYYKSVI